MTVGLRDSTRERDAMNSTAPGFHAVKRRVSALIKSATARLAERKFDPTLPPKVLFRGLGFCDSSDFSFLLIFFVIALDDAGFSFRHVDGDECLAAFMSITSNAIGSDSISLKYLKFLLPFIIDNVLHVFNHAITCSVFPTKYAEKNYCSAGGQSCFSVMSVRLLLCLFCPKGLSD
jgi:hypothetical protein